MKEIILKIIDENTYDIEAQCGTRYDAINIETDELAELITKALDNLTSSSRITHQRESLDALADYISEHSSPYDGKSPRDYVDDFLASNDG